MASIVRFDKFYPATTGTMGAAAQVNDVLVVACGSVTLNHATATVTGATATMAEQQFQSGTGSTLNALTILTGLVTGAGTPAFTVSADADMGFGCWIVRGLSSATKNTGNGAGPSLGNPLTATVNPSVVCTLIIAYLNESSNNFTSWNGSINAEGSDATHIDAYGDQLAVPSGSISPGANVTSQADNTICFIFLPETGGGVIPSTGAYQQEQSSTDRYQLEDGLGVYLIEPWGIVVTNFPPRWWGDLDGIGKSFPRDRLG